MSNYFVLFLFADFFELTIIAVISLASFNNGFNNLII